MSNRAAIAEPLEARTLFAGASVVRDALLVTANRAGTNAIVLSETTDGVDVAIQSVTVRGVTKNFSASFPKSLGYTRVVVRGGAGDDDIRFVGAGIQPGNFSLPI